MVAEQTPVAAPLVEMRNMYVSFGGVHAVENVSIDLQPGEIRTHSHTMNGAMSFPEHDIAGASGCCAHDYAASGSIDFTGSTDVNTNDSKYDSAVQAPYYTAYLCQAK